VKNLSAMSVLVVLHVLQERNVARERLAQVFSIAGRPLALSKLRFERRIVSRRCRKDADVRLSDIVLVASA